jgi:hypothetical protein
MLASQTGRSEKRALMGIKEAGQNMSRRSFLKLGLAGVSAAMLLFAAGCASGGDDDDGDDDDND